MLDIVPQRITINLDTRTDPLSGDPIPTISAALAQRTADGRLIGIGTRAIALQLDAQYEEVDRATGLPNGVFLTGEQVLAILLGLAHATEGA